MQLDDGEGRSRRPGSLEHGSGIPLVDRRDGEKGVLVPSQLPTTDENELAGMEWTLDVGPCFLNLVAKSESRSCR